MTGDATDFDLHCHSSVSDGSLAPEAVVARAAGQGVHVLALTDHDEIGGLDAARAAACAAGIAFVDGVEVSVTWRGSTIHIVGLRIDPGHPALLEGLGTVRSGRLGRAMRIGDELAEAGIEGTFEGALKYAANPGMVGRTHFARYLAEIGVVPDSKSAFKKYLVPGKPGYVAHEWTDLATAIGWIRASGGRAVMAHPGRYGLSAGALNDLMTEFGAAGGEAIEVVTGSHSPDQYAIFAEIAKSHGFLASRGSDFHAPGEGFADFGKLPPLAKGLTPVWHDWLV
jgi:predicted metal-dependent phosphoesterase TrpH